MFLLDEMWIVYYAYFCLDFKENGYPGKTCFHLYPNVYLNFRWFEVSFMNAYSADMQTHSTNSKKLSL